jgi:hypothetical protein
MWMLSTSVSEHGNKMAKGGLRHLQGHNKGLKNKFWMYMRDCILRILVFPDSFLNSRAKLPYTCSTCRAMGADPVGHTRRTPRCPYFPTGNDEGT